MLRLLYGACFHFCFVEFVFCLTVCFIAFALLLCLRRFFFSSFPGTNSRRLFVWSGCLWNMNEHACFFFLARAKQVPTRWRASNEDETTTLTLAGVWQVKWHHSHRSASRQRGNCKSSKLQMRLQWYIRIARGLFAVASCAIGRRYLCLNATPTVSGPKTIKFMQ